MKTGIFSWSKQAKDIIYDAHIKHDFQLKVEPTFNEILKAGFRWDNMLIDIRDFYLKWKVWEISTSKPRKMVIVEHIETYKQRERYQTDTILIHTLYEINLNIF